MRKRFKILNIVHSGTKGERGTPVTEKKYDGLVGCEVRFDINNICVGYSLILHIVPWMHKYYDYWTISAIERIDHDEEDGILILETLNSIYYLEELGD